MGICWCKEKPEESELYFQESSSGHRRSGVLPSSTIDYDKEDAETIDKLVLDTLGIIGSLVDDEQEPPLAMLRLHSIADNEDGWIKVVESMISIIPMDNPLGPSVITLLLDNCPLPSRESVIKLVDTFDLSVQSALNGLHNPCRERNICVVLGCIAEKLAGPSSLEILNVSTLDYLVTNLKPDMDANVILFALIALEKFAQTSENKAMIIRRLQNESPCPITILETWIESDYLYKRQVGFCAQWALDNLFVMENRKFTYLTVNNGHINAMLNTGDVSQYLKLSPDGLEARCDAYSFESVRCTAQTDGGGIWYYEVTIITPGVMQIGWATKDSNFLNHEGYGIGDDKYSVAFDGCRKLIWYNAKPDPQSVTRWRPGDILGCLLDLDQQRFIFSLNGTNLVPFCQVLDMAKLAKLGFFAAASFMSFQQCRFNFGAEPFKYPPSVPFFTFNSLGNLQPVHKRVLPRHIYLNYLRQQSIKEDSCTLCYDKKASVRLIPCEHSGFCAPCISRLTDCPMCRSSILRVIEDNL